MAVINGDIVISALLMRFEVKIREDQLDAMTWRCGEVPCAVLFVWIRIRIVGAGQFGVWVRNLKGTTSLFAVVAVLVQHKAIVAFAHVRANGIEADMLTSAVIEGTFVFVYEQLVSIVSARA